MKISTICACRGDGRGYLNLRVSGTSQNSRLSLLGTTPTSKHVPMQLYVTDESAQEKNVVIVFPLVPCSIDYTLTEISEEGDQLTSCKRSIRPLILKWASRYNYRFKKQQCYSIRNIEDTDYFKHATIDFKECVPTATDTILRGTLTIPTKNNIPYELRLLDEEFNQLPLNLTIMNDALLPLEYDEVSTLRFVDFSLRIPRDIKTYIIEFVDASDTIRQNFACFEPSLYAFLLKRFHDLTLDAAHDPNYQIWAAKRKPTDAFVKQQKRTKFEYAPLISIIVPLYRTPPVFFREMVESVLAQTYSNFELILVNADTGNSELSAEVADALSRDRRVREVRCAENKGISLNTAEGVKVSQGDYLAFLDHDDLLEPDTLFEYISAINKESSIDLLYCDEDKLFPDGSYGDAYFKPDFSLFLLREINYICHFLMIRKTIVSEVEAPDSKYDGAQDHRMILQAVEQGANVHHVPTVLYHWRICEGSTAAGADSKPYADIAGKLAIENHLKKQGIAARVENTDAPCRYRVTYEPALQPLVSIVIPNKDNADVLAVCIDSIFDKSAYENFEVIIVENNSTQPETFDYYTNIAAQDPRISIITWEHEFNFSKLMNFGASKASGEYLILLNNDTEVISPRWIDNMLGICQQSQVGIVGAKLYYRDGTIQHAGVGIGGKGAGHINVNLDMSSSGYFNTAITTHELSAVTAACMMTKRSVFFEVGGFEEDFAVAFNDVDYCLKVRRSDKLVVFCAEAELYHYESLSRGYETTASKQIRFHREASLLNYRWPKYFVAGDPYLNPNLYPGNMYYRLNDQNF